MERKDESLNFLIFVESRGWNKTSVLDLTVTSFDSDPDLPSLL